MRVKHRVLAMTLYPLYVGGLISACSSEVSPDGRFRVVEHHQALDPHADVPRPPADAVGCWIWETSGGFRDGYDPTVAYIHRTFDPEARLITHEIAYSYDTDSDLGMTLYWRLDAEGRTLTYAGEGENLWQDFRQDYVRDEHGNPVRYEATYGSFEDLAEPAHGDRYAFYEVTHRYDEQGLLLESKIVASDSDLATRRTYTHDGEGRCQSITIERNGLTEVETLFYEDDRVVEKVITRTRNISLLEVVTYTYDEHGRLVAQENDGSPGWGSHDADGIPDITSHWTYYDDGSSVTEFLNFMTDSPNDTIVRDGVQEYVYHIYEARSPGCNELEATIPKPPTLACTY